MEMKNQPEEHLIEALISAASKENWEEVDNILVPQLSRLNGNKAAEILLKHSKSENPNIRDVVATSFRNLEVSDPETKEKIDTEMINMAVNDPEEFPSGRAALYLINEKIKEPDNGKISNSINSFIEKANINKWNKDLLENIPDLSSILKVN